MSNDNLPPLPYWVKLDNHGGLTPNAMHASVTAYGKACYEAGKRDAVAAASGAGVPAGWREKLIAISDWMESRTNKHQIGIDQFDYASSFDYELGQAASELAQLAAAPTHDSDGGAI